MNRPVHHPDRFAGKVALVTGAAQGIGRVVALRLAREGAGVIIADAHEEQARAVAAEIKADGGHAYVIVANLETADAARRVVGEAVEKFSVLDVAIHNVGGTIWSKPFWEYEEKQIEKEINRSLWPTLWGCWAVVPHMRARRRGAIVNIGSLAVRSIYRVPYAAAKGGVHAITQCMAEELEDCGVRVNCVAPGGIDVGERVIPRNPEPLSVPEQEWKRHMTAQTIAMTPLRRYGHAEEVASAVCFLAADEASYITGQVLYVAGGADA